MNAAAPQPRANQGQPVPRIDARLKVTGEARFAADIPVNNVAYGVLVTSDIARGAVRSINLDAARATPGVLDIISYGDVGTLAKPRFSSSSYTSLAPLHDRTIWHDGQIMALVVAETFEAAQEAAGKVTADYEPSRPSADLDSAGTQSLEAVGNTERIKKNPSAGNFSSAFQSAPVKIEAEYRNADADPQSDGTVLNNRSLVGWSVDDL